MRDNVLVGSHLDAARNQACFQSPALVYYTSSISRKQRLLDVRFLGDYSDNCILVKDFCNGSSSSF